MLKQFKYFLIRLFYNSFRRSKVIQIDFSGNHPFGLGDIVMNEKHKKFKHIGKSLFVEFNP
jgi:hypothetical protein